ncbi:MAG: universal stress protein [Desulfomonile tiedjei]|nr:universal stress protein [Desulfomonile tiedjei]
MQGIGLCAIFSQQGDWAFDYALWLARKQRTRLFIFHFLDSPYALRRDVVFVDEQREQVTQVTPDLIAEKDKELRLTYDDRLGGYVDVGFRLCEGSTERELKRCFRRGEYDVLVLAYENQGALFAGNASIEKFASRFRGPVVLVGPDRPDRYFLNREAQEMVRRLNIPPDKWGPV